MYMVVSKWGIVAGHEAEVAEKGRAVRDVLRRQPGVQFVYEFKNEDGVFVAVIAYDDEAAYKRIIQDPNGAFMQAVSQYRLEEHAVWVGSERGEAID
ncbi:MAG: hypothetical protein K1X67_25175 [Fimbriimonadaceae bacterium]|nr:hypothetical protein [Fimbriimonadaceae bacterium]